MRPGVGLRWEQFTQSADVREGSLQNVALQRVMYGTAIVMLLAACTSPTGQGVGSSSSTVSPVVTSSAPSLAPTPQTRESTSATAPVHPDGPESLATVEVVSSTVAYVYTPLTSLRHVVPALLVTTDGARTFHRAEYGLMVALIAVVPGLCPVSRHHAVPPGHVGADCGLRGVSASRSWHVRSAGSDQTRWRGPRQAARAVRPRTHRLRVA